jgi:hypothetical protein
MKRNTNRKKKKPEITIMTLLACECPKEATALLLQNGGKRAKNHKDLEHKLGEMYVKSDDKAGLEKEMANLHPHKKWLDRVAEPQIKKSIKVEPDPEVVAEKIDPKLIERVASLEQRSSFFGVNNPVPTETKTNEEKSNDKIIMVGLVTIVAIMGMAVLSNRLTKI